MLSPVGGPRYLPSLYWDIPSSMPFMNNVRLKVETGPGSRRPAGVRDGPHRNTQAPHVALLPALLRLRLQRIEKLSVGVSQEQSA